jgi:hypothetical protein
MKTTLVQPTNNKAYRLLKDLEEKMPKKGIKPYQKLSEKYAGKLPNHIADELRRYVKQSRQEWESRTTW